jgi:hypothetical protein
LTEYILRGEVFRVIVVRIEGQYRTSELVHDVPGRGLHDTVFGKILRQGPVPPHEEAELVKLFLGRQGTVQKKIDGFFKTVTAFGGGGVSKVRYVYTPVKEPAVYRYFFAFFHNITVNVSYTGQSHKYASPVCVTEPPFDAEFVVEF